MDAGVARGEGVAVAVRAPLHAGAVGVGVVIAPAASIAPTSSIAVMAATRVAGLLVMEPFRDMSPRVASCVVISCDERSARVSHPDCGRHGLGSLHSYQGHPRSAGAPGAIGSVEICSVNRSLLCSEMSINLVWSIEIRSASVPRADGRRKEYVVEMNDLTHASLTRRSLLAAAGGALLAAQLPSSTTLRALAQEAGGGPIRWSLTGVS